MGDSSLNRVCHMEMRTRSKGKKPVLTRPDTPPGSPSTNCAICLGVCDNKSYSDTCFHQFCFNCLLTWSQVKAECPLCKQRFNKIIYNIKSDREYDEHRVEQRTFIDDDDDISILSNSAFAAINNTSQRFRYRTTLTLERRHQNALEDLLRMTTHEVLTGRAFHHGEAARTLGFLEVESPRPLAHAPGFGGRTRAATTVRRTIYERGLYAYPLPDLTGRFRESSPEFYRFNQTQIHRLVPWLSREITAILPSSSNVAYIISMITDMLPEHSISSHFFATMLRPFFNEYTEHFAHEFSVFASTPYDITGYDRAVQYRHVDVMSEVVSDSDSRDSDIIEVPNPEPSHSAAIPGRSAIDDVITIETIDNSDTDDSASEVMVVGYIKPPEQRTPPVVDLVASDSDVILQEDVEPPGAPVYSAEPLGESSSGPLVKLSLRRKRPHIIDSDSDWDIPTGEIPTRRKKKRHTRTLGASTYPSHGDISNNETSTSQSSGLSSEWTSSDSSGVDSSYSSSDDSTVPHVSPRLRHKVKCKASLSRSISKSGACSSTCERRSSCHTCNNSRKRSENMSIQDVIEKSSKRTKRAAVSKSEEMKQRADKPTDSTDSYYTADSSDRKKGKKKEKKSTKDRVKGLEKRKIESSKSKGKKQKVSSQSTCTPQVFASTEEHNDAGPSNAPWPSLGAPRLSPVMPGPSCSASAPSRSARYLDAMSPSGSEEDSPKIKSVINVVSPWTPTEPQPSCSVPKTNLLLTVAEADDAPGFPVKYESLLDIMNTAVLNPSNGVLACHSTSDAGPSAARRLNTRVLSQVFTALVDTSNDSESKPLNLSFKKEQ